MPAAVMTARWYRRAPRHRHHGRPAGRYNQASAAVGIRHKRQLASTADLPSLTSGTAILTPTAGSTAFAVTVTDLARRRHQQRTSSSRHRAAAEISPLTVTARAPAPRSAITVTRARRDTTISNITTNAMPSINTPAIAGSFAFTAGYILGARRNAGLPVVNQLLTITPSLPARRGCISSPSSATIIPYTFTVTAQREEPPVHPRNAAQRNAASGCCHSRKPLL